MNELTRQSQSETAPAHWGPEGYCHYCGAGLDPRFYFCLSCATPYKGLESVVTPHMPRRLTDGERIAELRDKESIELKLPILKKPRQASLRFTY